MSNLAMMMGLTAVKVDSLEFTFVGVSYPASNLNILVPTGTQAGDIAVALSSTAVTSFVPAVYSGFTQITTLNSTFEDMFQYKLLTEADLTTTFMRSSGNYDSAIMLTFRPSRPVTNVIISNVNDGGMTAATPSTQTLSPSSSPSILIANYAGYNTATAINGGFWGGDYLFTGENNARIRTYYEIQNDQAIPRDVVPSGDYGSYNRLTSCVINAE